MGTVGILETEGMGNAAGTVDGETMAGFWDKTGQSCTGSSIVGSASVLSAGFEAESVSILSSLSSSWSLISFSSSVSDLEGQIIQEYLLINANVSFWLICLLVSIKLAIDCVSLSFGLWFRITQAVLTANIFTQMWCPPLDQITPYTLL